MHVDDSDLNVLNLNQKTTLEVVEEAQALLNAWHFALRISGGELKLEKCFWTLQDYVWEKDECVLSRFTPYQLTVNMHGQSQPLSFLSPYKTRTLVGSAINPDNYTLEIVESFTSKIAQLSGKLSQLSLSHQQILFGYNTYWWPSIK